MGNSTYAYNGLGQRVQQTVSGTVTRYLLDVQPGLFQTLTLTTGADITRHVHGPMGVLWQTDPQGSLDHLLPDGLGSIRTVTDAGGTPLDTRRYSPYGEPASTTGTSQTSLGFTGEMTDANGLVFLRARYYSPTLGVFTGLDPLEGSLANPLSFNRYSWVEGNVANRTDPTGLDNSLLACLAAALADGPIVVGDIVCGIYITVSIAAALLLFSKGLVDALSNVLASIFPSGSSFPCSRDPSYGMRSYGPFGTPLFKGHPYNFDPLGDMLCHLRHYGGAIHASMFEALHFTRGVMFSDTPLQLSLIHRGPGFSHYSGPGGTIHIPPPIGMDFNQGISPGTRADRLASFVEEIRHAAQFHGLIPNMSCGSTTLLRGEVDAKTQKLFWLRLSGIPIRDFVFTFSTDLAGGLSGLVDNIIEDYGSFADPRRSPLFPAYTQVGDVKLPKPGYAVCPGPVEVPFVLPDSLPQTLCVSPLTMLHLFRV